jgi:hypothetical protein
MVFTALMGVAVVSAAVAGGSKGSPIDANLTSMTGCHTSSWAPYISACVGINGSGVRVESVDGGLVLGPRASLYGHWHIVGYGININTPNRQYWNQSYWHTYSWNSGWYYIGRNLPYGSSVCSTFWSWNGYQYTNRGTACGTIG